MLIVQFEQLDGQFDEDCAFAEEMDGLFDAALRMTNLGECDGWDIGSGTINLFCVVADARRACGVLVQVIEHEGLQDIAVIALSEDVDDDQEAPAPHVIWPPDFVGTFSIL